MTKEQAEKEFEEWWKGVDEPLFLYSTIAKKAWLEAHSRQQARIEKLIARLKKDSILAGFDVDEWEKKEVEG